jgi:hypothetical protein
MKILTSLYTYLFATQACTNGDEGSPTTPSGGGETVMADRESVVMIVPPEDPADNLPRVVHNRGPLTKKVVASGSHGSLDFSMVAWKFADGTIEGHMEEKLQKNGEILVKVNVDCMNVRDGRAIVGGNIVEVNHHHLQASATTPDLEQRQEMIDLHSIKPHSRAYRVVVDSNDSHQQKMSSLLVNLPEDTNCDNMFDTTTMTSMSMTDQNVMVCNRRDGEEAWLNCMERRPIINSKSNVVADATE